MKKNLLKYLIIATAVIIIIIIVFMANIKEQNNQNIATNSDNTVNEQVVENDGDGDFDVTNINISYNEYATISSCIPRYLDLTVKGGILSDSQKSERIYSMLSQNTIEENNINQNNVLNKVKVLNSKYYITITESDILIQDVVNTYSVHVIATDSENNYIQDMLFIINFDNANDAFSIEEVTNKFNSFSDITSAKIEKIEKNNYNELNFKTINKEDICRMYFEHMKSLLIARPDIAYNLMEESYKAKRFGSYEYFEEYIQNNKERLTTITPDKYKINDDNTEIIIQDQHKNRYKFYIEKPMQYTYMLDNYIVLNEDDIKYYSSLSGEEKVEYNLDRIQKMYKYKDYKFIYEILDDTFKEENYPTLNDFINFINQELNGNYEIGSKEITKDGNIYEVELEISNPEKSYSQKYFNVIMRLDTGTDFTMSFSKE